MERSQPVRIERPKPNPHGYGRLIVASTVALIFAILFVLGGPFTLNSIYDLILRLFNRSSTTRPWEPGSPLTVIPLASGGLIVGAYLGNIAWNLGASAGSRWERMESGEKVTLFLGIFAGLIASMPFIFLFNALPIANSQLYLPVFIVGLTLGFASIAVYALQSMNEILPWYKNRGPVKRSGIKILDTNVIIDGRIYDVARSGFLEGEIYIPRFVLEELQHIADHHDGLKRQRGRRGLDVLKRIQAEFPIVEVGKYDRHANDPNEEVDARLVRLAKSIGADIVTNDWNLNSVAKLQKVKILNINELALNLRPNVLPQEQLRLNIIKEGNQHGQGVGYLEDGTMVVVEGGKGHIGETLDVTVTQVIQTERGKMIFAEVPDLDDEADSYAMRRRRRQ